MTTLMNRGLLALLMTTTATFWSTAASADGTGWMIGGGVYYSDLDDWGGLNPEDIDWDDLENFDFGGSSVAYNINGGYRFNKWLAIDGGYTDLGSFDTDRNNTGDRESFDVDTFTLGGMVSVPLWIIDLYAKGGAAFWDYDGSNVDESGTDAYYGLGLAFNIGSSLDLYGEWIQYDLESKVDTFGLGVRWTF